MKSQAEQHSIRALSRVLEVSRSGFYAWASRRPSSRAQENAELTARIGRIHEQSRGTYGAPRVHAELAAGGRHVARKRVALLMREKGLRGVSRRKWTTTTKKDWAAAVAPDLIKRDFAADGPDQLWVADITYVPTWAGFLYLAVVLDAWSRRVVGWGLRRAPQGATGPCRTGDGRPPTPATICDTPLGSRQSVHIDRLRSALSRSRSEAVDGKCGRRVRQRDVRVVLRHAGM